ncbi:MAG: RimK/LysX family protein [Actinomycetota bacterium]
MPRHDLMIVGWREWLAIPEIGIGALKAKVDTGARTSALHAEDIETFEDGGVDLVRFVTRPGQGPDGDPVQVVAPLVGEGEIRSSNGEAELRPVVAVRIEMPFVRLGRRSEGDRPAPAGLDAPIEMTLTDRSSMGFRMLLGRTALAGHLAVDAGSSYLLGRPPRAIRRRNRSDQVDAP